MAKSSFYSGTGITNNEQNAIDGAKNAAEAARDAAQVAQAAAETAETNAETAATSASGQATIATTKASEASTSATTAATHASTATTKASEASTSATNAATSATNAATSKTNAATSETNAASSASTATTKASEASTSASTATTKASEAASSATTASTQATNAATSATNAASSETNAATSATNAASSATTASTQATNAASSATTASTQATNASSSASTATTKASEASSSASSASAAQTAAEGARDSALAAFDSFDDRYLGVKSSDPTTDNDGDALAAGMLYFSSTDTAMKVYSGSAWVDAYVSGQDYMSLTGGTMTGDITFNSTQLFDGRDVSVDGIKLDGIESNATADQTAAEIKTAYESNSDTNAFTDADHSKLSAIEASADVTDAANVNPLVDSHLNTSTASSGEYLSWNGSDYDWASVPAGYADSDVDTHLNTSGASTNQYLKWNGSDYAWSTVDLSNVDAVTVDGLDSTQFLRSDAADAATGQIDFQSMPKVTVAGFAGFEYHNTSGQWESYVGTENNAGGLRYNARQNDHTFYTNSTERMRLTTTGLGIGGIAPVTPLHISGGSATRADIQITTNATGNTSGNGFQVGYIDSVGAFNWNYENTDWYVGTNNNRRLTINGSGDLLVGKTVTTFGTEGIAAFNSADSGGSRINITNDGGTPLNLNRLTSDGDIAGFYKDGTSVGSIASRSGVVSTIVLDPRSGQGAGLTGASSALTPVDETGAEVDNDVSLGNNFNRFKDLYLSGSLSNGTTSRTVADIVGLTSSQFLRSDAADTFTGKLTYTGSNEGLEVAGIRGAGLGSQTGDYIHMYERVHIGSPSGWGSGNAPSYGLSTHGGAEFNTGSVSGAPFTFQGNTIWHAGNATGAGYVDTATGNYGTIKVDDDRGVTWAGYAIRDDWVFMSDWAGSCGIYNDTDNEWAIYIAQNAGTALYYNGTATFATVSGGAAVTGALTATGDITAYYSDERLKNFEGKIDGALDKVSKLSGYYYRENDKAKELGYENDARQVGVSAQEVEAVMPEVVKPAPVDPEYKTVQYEKLVPLLIEAIKELKEEVRQLKEDKV